MTHNILLSFKGKNVAYLLASYIVYQGDNLPIMIHRYALCVPHWVGFEFVIIPWVVYCGSTRPSDISATVTGKTWHSNKEEVTWIKTNSFNLVKVQHLFFQTAF